eukprot:3701761-Pleurochrysis_carterae.AAC.5
MTFLSCFFVRRLCTTLCAEQDLDQRCAKRRVAYARVFCQEQCSDAARCVHATMSKRQSMGNSLATIVIADSRITVAAHTLVLRSCHDVMCRIIDTQHSI